MTKLRKGDLVMMTKDLKTIMQLNGSGEHVKEFGECVGLVDGLTNNNNDGEYDLYKIGPEVEVYWLPHMIRFAYMPRHLVKIGSVKEDFRDKIKSILWTALYKKKKKDIPTP